MVFRSQTERTAIMRYPVIRRRAEVPTPTPLRVPAAFKAEPGAVQGNSPKCRLPHSRAYLIPIRRLTRLRFPVCLLGKSAVWAPGTTLIPVATHSVRLFLVVELCYPVPVTPRPCGHTWRELTARCLRIWMLPRVAQPLCFCIRNRTVAVGYGGAEVPAWS